MGSALQRLSPRQRQYVTLAAILVCGVGLLWLIFALTDTRSPTTDAKNNGSTQPATVTNIGVMPPGQQVNPVDQWVGTAGRKLAQYENERDEQNRLNKDRQAFEARTMQRFAELEQKLTSASQATSMPSAPNTAAASSTPAPPTMPPASSLPIPPAPSSTASTPAKLPGQSVNIPPPLPPGTSPAGAMPLGDPGTAPQDIALNAPVLTRVSLVDRETAKAAATGTTASTTNNATPGSPSTADTRTVSTFLPVSFTRGTLLGGLDAPTGGQAQSNPHPVLIRLSDNSVLPNRFRGEYRDCFVIAAGYGDISSERAYLRTENLSCVRPDGATLEVKIQGSIYGEDGKVGMRGRLVTKQGQMLANALLAGVVSGIGQGLATSSTTYSTSALGTIASSGGSGSDAYRAGIGTGVGKALDRLAQYYIKLAENTFPVIEIDASREVDVVITKGVRIDVPMSANTYTSTSGTPSITLSRSAEPAPEDRYLKAANDDNY
ncbi:MAG: conjugal transfer protein TraB [Burkholderiales bacterium]|nr:conjugal transfer protein TraB [Burkholderiales bacterium]